MDELFREAAAGYPLKTDNSEWDRIASRLLSTPATPVPAQKKKKNNFNKYGPPLLLLVLMLVLGNVPYKQKNNLQTGFRQPGTGYAVIPVEKGIVQKQNSARTRRQQAPSRNEKINASKIINEPKPHAALPIEPLDLSFDTEKPAIANNINAANIAPYLLSKEEDTASKKKPAPIHRSPKIYWGFVFGPAFNRIKNQQWEKPGFDIGIVAGISLLKGKALVETGLLYTQKYYYSDGKYFDMGKAGGSMPPGMEIMSLEGSSRLFEIPVKVKYRVLQKNKSGFFLSTGISSYIMTREENNYNAMMNGSPEPMTGSYNDKSRYIAVMANIGAEYNYSLGKRTRLRIEPYIQIPLKGIGIGSMPVMTTGLHVGLMRFRP